ncbi:MAG: sensor histidine kinase, partial [Chloroflexi bacterium]|nr:sensor histidine kinase [Chloroflexota bacterium]
IVELERLPTNPKRPVDCDELINGVATYTSPRAEKSGITFTQNVVGDLPVIQGYANELYKALIELVDNALEHTPPGGSITLQARKDAGALMIVLADTGEGIPAEALPRVFDMMYRVEAHRPIGGQHSGLGLPIARKIIAQHGGLIALDSTVGKGTVVQIRLPL